MCTVQAQQRCVAATRTHTVVGSTLAGALHVPDSRTGPLAYRGGFRISEGTWCGTRTLAAGMSQQAPAPVKHTCMHCIG